MPPEVCYNREVVQLPDPGFASHEHAEGENQGDDVRRNCATVKESHTLRHHQVMRANERGRSTQSRRPEISHDCRDGRANAFDELKRRALTSVRASAFGCASGVQRRVPQAPVPSASSSDTAHSANPLQYSGAVSSQGTGASDAYRRQCPLPHATRMLRRVVSSRQRKDAALVGADRCGGAAGRRERARLRGGRHR